MSTDKFYVYELWNPIRNEPFYVGKGKVDRHGMLGRYRAHLLEARQVSEGKRKKNYKLSLILKILRENYNVECKIVLETYDENEAFTMEKKLIKYYGRHDLKTGPLTNLTEGGDGTSGYVYSEEQCKRRSEDRKGEKGSMYGIRHTNQSKLEMSIKRGRSVYGIDDNGNIIYTFHSAKAASRHFMQIETTVSNNIATVATKFKHWQCYGYYWRYADEYNPDENFLILGKFKGNRHPILQIDIHTNDIINEWRSIADAEANTNGERSSIRRAIKNNKPYKGYYWKFVPRPS